MSSVPKTMKPAAKDKTFTALMEENNKLLIEQNLLLASLTKCLGDPKSDKGWLERIHVVLECTKKGNNERHSFGFKFSIGTAILAIVAIIIESVNRGEASAVLAFLKAAKGFM